MRLWLGFVYKEDLGGPGNCLGVSVGPGPGPGVRGCAFVRTHKPQQQPGPAPASTLADVYRWKKANVPLIFVCKYLFEAEGYCRIIEAGKQSALLKGNIIISSSLFY